MAITKLQLKEIIKESLLTVMYEEADCEENPDACTPEEAYKQSANRARIDKKHKEHATMDCPEGSYQRSPGGPCVASAKSRVRVNVPAWPGSTRYVKRSSSSTALKKNESLSLEEITREELAVILQEALPTAQSVRDPERRHAVGSRIVPRDVGQPALDPQSKSIAQQRQGLIQGAELVRDIESGDAARRQRAAADEKTGKEEPPPGPLVRSPEGNAITIEDTEGRRVLQPKPGEFDFGADAARFEHIVREELETMLYEVSPTADAPKTPAKEKKKEREKTTTVTGDREAAQRADQLENAPHQMSPKDKAKAEKEKAEKMNIVKKHKPAGSPFVGPAGRIVTAAERAAKVVKVAKATAKATEKAKRARAAKKATERMGKPIGRKDKLKSKPSPHDVKKRRRRAQSTPTPRERREAANRAAQAAAKRLIKKESLQRIIQDELETMLNEQGYGPQGDLDQDGHGQQGQKAQQAQKQKASTRGAELVGGGQVKPPWGQQTAYARDPEWLEKANKLRGYDPNIPYAGSHGRNPWQREFPTKYKRPRAYKSTQKYTTDPALRSVNVEEKSTLPSGRPYVERGGVGGATEQKAWERGRQLQTDILGSSATEPDVPMGAAAAYTGRGVSENLQNITREELSLLLEDRSMPRWARAPRKLKKYPAKGGGYYTGAPEDVKRIEAEKEKARNEEAMARFTFDYPSIPPDPADVQIAHDAARGANKATFGVEFPFIEDWPGYPEHGVPNIDEYVDAQVRRLIPHVTDEKWIQKTKNKVLCQSFDICPDIDDPIQEGVITERQETDEAGDLWTHVPHWLKQYGEMSHFGPDIPGTSLAREYAVGPASKVAHMGSKDRYEEETTQARDEGLMAIVDILTMGGPMATKYLSKIAAKLPAFRGVQGWKDASAATETAAKEVQAVTKAAQIQAPARPTTQDVVKQVSPRQSVQDIAKSARAAAKPTPTQLGRQMNPWSQAAGPKLVLPDSSGRYIELIGKPFTMGGRTFQGVRFPDGRTTYFYRSTGRGSPGVSPPGQWNPVGGLTSTPEGSTWFLKLPKLHRQAAGSRGKIAKPGSLYGKTSRRLEDFFNDAPLYWDTAKYRNFDNTLRSAELINNMMQKSGGLKTKWLHQLTDYLTKNLNFPGPAGQKAMQGLDWENVPRWEKIIKEELIAMLNEGAVPAVPLDPCRLGAYYYGEDEDHQRRGTAASSHCPSSPASKTLDRLERNPQMPPHRSRLKRPLRKKGKKTKIQVKPKETKKLNAKQRAKKEITDQEERAHTKKEK